MRFEGTGGFPGHWRFRSIEDVCVNVTSGGTPSRRSPDFYQNGTVGWVKTKELQDAPIRETEECITVAAIEESSAKLLPSNTVLMAMYGATVGMLGILEEDMACNQACCAMIFDPEKADYRYAFYRLLNERDHIKSLAIGAAQQNLSAKSIKEFEFPFPPVEEQNRVAKIIGGLDDKIQLNHKINQTLEQMAQAIFKSWFVDFEPVKAKIAALEAGGSEEDARLAAMQAIAGKTEAQLARLQTEHPDHYAELRATADLFPSVMQESELGEIPAGWNCLALDEIAKYKNGLALQKYRPENEGDFLPVVKIAQLKKGYADGEEKASPYINPECVIDDGDVLFSWSGSLMVDTWCGGRAALNQHLFKVTSERYPKWLYFHFTRHHLEEFQRIAADKAVTMGHIKREHLKRAFCAIPDSCLIAAAGKSLEGMLQQQINLRLEAVSLSQLRDTLLPKLLSGEITVPDTETQLSDARETAHV